jgi:hypothetical protein
MMRALFVTEGVNDSISSRPSVGEPVSASIQAFQPGTGNPRGHVLGAPDHLPTGLDTINLRPKEDPFPERLVQCAGACPGGDSDAEAAPGAERDTRSSQQPRGGDRYASSSD